MLQVLAFFVLFGGVSAGTNEVGKAYLADMKGKPGVVTLPSGLMYKVLKEGTGEDHPTVDSPCECFYAGTTPSLTPNAADVPDDTEALNKDWNDFDSGYKRGSTTTFAPNQVIKGWTEAMQLMVEGDKWEMYIPSELGYGDRGSPPKIGGGDVLVFTMEIIKINGDKKPASKCDPKTYDGCSEKESTYLKGKAELSAGAIGTEIKRLNGMASKKMSSTQSAWLSARVNLLGKLQKLKEEL
jgi:FKBP-type peptidyl-prolyl cis-trans isomerase FklB